MPEEINGKPHFREKTVEFVEVDWIKHREMEQRIVFSCLMLMDVEQEAMRWLETIRLAIEKQKPGLTTTLPEVVRMCIFAAFSSAEDGSLQVKPRQ